MNASQIFSRNPLDRGERQRRDETWIHNAAREATSKFLPLWHLKVPVSAKSENSLAWQSFEVLCKLDIEIDPIFLGLMDGEAYFTADISQLGNEAHGLQNDGKWMFENARSAAELVSTEEAGILCQAIAQINWHNNHRFCSVCGHKTWVKRGGQMRQCPNCEAQHFPRTDPVVITVVSDQGNCLLGQSRGRMSRANTYSALAGFVDQGESIEEAVAREVMEEAGIKINNIRYLFSQPWPFPHSLMIGCHANAVTTEIVKDDHEMDDVRWFSRDEVQLALEGKSTGLRVPGPTAIAHHLIKVWAANEKIIY